MNSTVFKYKHHYQQQHQPFHTMSNTNRNQNSNNGNKCGISSHNNNNNNNNNSNTNNNQNSIFILNTAANNILPNNHQLYYSDLTDVVPPSSLSSSSSSSSSVSAGNSAAASSVWSSASSTMCSPAAHALQKLFNCSSSSSSSSSGSGFKFNHGYNMGIESKTFLKSKSEILKKKSKFWKYLEDEDNDKNNQKSIADTQESEKQLLAKGFKFKSCNSLKSLESSDHNQEDLSELLEYSCSLCDSCRCVDCEIGYFDCENSDDSNSEYSFHLSAYEEDETADNSDSADIEVERQVDLKSPEGPHCCLQTTCKNCCSANDDQKLKTNFELPSICCAACCVDKQRNCSKTDCCQQCFMVDIDAAARVEANRPIFITAKHH